MNFGEQINKVKRKIERTRHIPKGVDKDIYHAVQKITPNKYEPRLIGKGGEHLVFNFEDPKHPNTVYKVNYLSAASLLNAKQLGKKQESKTRAAIDLEILRRNHRTRELKDYFGFQAVPVQRYMIKDVPINIDTIAKIMPSLPIDPANIPKKIPAWVTVQRKIDLPTDFTVSLNGHYPELRINSADAKERKLYEKTGDLLLNCDPKGETPERQKEQIRMLYDNLSTTDIRAGLDPKFKEKLQETVKSLIQYTEKTENALDLAGKNNVVLTKLADEWELKLPDPLPNADFTFDDIRKAVKKLSDDKKLTHPELIKTLNVINTIRVINSLAILADIPQRIRIPAKPKEAMPQKDPDELDIDISVEDEETGDLTPLETAPNTEPSRFLNIPVLQLLDSLAQLKKRA